MKQLERRTFTPLNLASFGSPSSEITAASAALITVASSSAARAPTKREAHRDSTRTLQQWFLALTVPSRCRSRLRSLRRIGEQIRITVVDVGRLAPDLRIEAVRQS